MMKRAASVLSSIVTAWAAVCALTANAQDNPRYAFTQDYEPAPALWELSDEDTTIYMLGTIHLLPEGFRWRNPQLDRIIETAETLVVETSDADSAGAMDKIGPKIANFLQWRSPTSQQLSSGSQERWRQLVSQSGMPFDYVDSIPVMVALLGLGQAEVEGDPSSYEYGVETILEREFAQTDRTVESIEDFGRVTYSLFRVNDADIVGELDMQLREWSGKPMDGLYDTALHDLTGEEYWEMEHAWARGEVADDFDLGFGAGKIGTAFREILLNRRNRQWAAWLEERLDQPGTVLLAVGAGHFEGPESLLVWLEQRGLKADRIN
ncbi:MAG: TraB/GumN family protein [Alteraurantiacibacter sp.]